MSTLTDLFTNIANAIRSKTGDTATIIASDFPTAISNISTGTQDPPVQTFSTLDTVRENGYVDKEVITIPIAKTLSAQPIMDSNGTMGGDDFAVDQSSCLNSGTKAYNLFKGDNSSTWHSSSGGAPQWIAWYNPSPLTISQVDIKNRADDPNNPWIPQQYKIQACNDNSTWVDLTETITNTVTDTGAWENPIVIPEANRAGYLYYRLYITACSSYCALSRITLTGSGFVGLVPEQIN